MDFGILDSAQALFLSALKAGTLSLGIYSVPLLSAMSLLAWYWNFGRSLMMGGGQMGDALAAALLTAMYIGIAYWLVVNIAPITEALYATFLLWGQSVGGGTATQALLTPSSVASIGFTISAPLDAFIQGHSGFSGIVNFPTLAFYGLVNFGLLVVFPVVAVALIVCQIEFALSAMLGAILLPFGVFGPTAFLTEFCVGWIVGSAVRVLVIAAIVGLGFPLFATVNLPTGPHGNPTIFGAIVMLVVGVFYAGLACTIPGRAANMCGRATLGLTSQAVLGAAMSGGSFVVAGAQAVRGVSQMIKGKTTT